MIIEIMDWILLGLLQQKSEIIKGIFLYLIGRYWYIICYIPGLFWIKARVFIWMVINLLCNWWVFKEKRGYEESRYR